MRSTLSRALSPRSRTIARGGMLNFSAKNLCNAAFAFPFIAGITTAWLAGPAVPAFLPHDFTGKLALGLLASGGSGFWNSILTYVTKAKDVKAAEAESRQVEARAKKGSPAKHSH